MIRILGMLLAALVFAAAAQVTPALAQSDPQNTLVLETTKGPVVIKLRNDIAPGHAERIKQLARDGFYNNVPFHRVIPGFMAQTGDGDRGDGRGKSKYPNIKAEFSQVPFKRGVVGMARASDPNSANCQFFITYADAPHLNGAIHRDRRSGVGHGQCRQDEEGRTGDRSRSHHSRLHTGRQEIRRTTWPNRKTH